MSWKRAWVACVATLVAGLVLLEQIAPADFATLFHEDGWAEWATFLAFLVAAVLAIDGARRQAGRERLLLAAIAAFCIVVAGEEISWGQRLAGYSPPEIFLRANYQQELNFHNFLRGIFDTRWQVLLVALLYGLLWPAAARLGWAPSGWSPRQALMLPAAAVVGLEWAYPFDLAGEMAELVLGLFFVGDAATRRAGEPGFALAVPAQAAVLAVAVGVAPLLDVVLYRPRADQIAAARAEVARLASELQRDGALTSRALRKRRMHKRVFTAASTRQVRLDTAGDERRRYFLDPWNQPYWVLFERRGSDAGRVVIYSFGPNRRRDSRLKPLGDGEAVLHGDDIGVTFPIHWTD